MADKKKAARAPAKIGFIESMECLPVPTLPEGKEWSYEIKLDGFRLEAVRQKGETTLFSRRGNILNRKFPYIAAALEGMPDDTILDGEVVALDEQGRSDFNLLQNFRSAESKIHYYVFDILALKGRDVSTLPLAERRKILDKALKRKIDLRTSKAAIESGRSLVGHNYTISNCEIANVVSAGEVTVHPVKRRRLRCAQMGTAVLDLIPIERKNFAAGSDGRRQCGGAIGGRG